MYGNKDQMLPIWPTLSRSPILRQFGWSALAHAAFVSNRALFSPEPLITPYTTTPSCAHCIDPYLPLPGLLAVHLRRGDFVEHCENLGHWGASFNAFASFSSFPDPWVPFEGSEEERMSVYMRRCLPTIEQVVEKVEAVRAAVGSSDGGLQNVYVMTNADEAWLEELKDALRAGGAWERIATSRDMVWTPEQKYVSQATDMMIGQRAQVFIGNGVRVHTHILVLANEPIANEPLRSFLFRYSSRACHRTLRCCVWRRACRRKVLACGDVQARATLRPYLPIY